MGNLTAKDNTDNTDNTEPEKKNIAFHSKPEGGDEADVIGSAGECQSGFFDHLKPITSHTRCHPLLRLG